jgi:hypothetical protein
MLFTGIRLPVPRYWQWFHFAIYACSLQPYFRASRSANMRFAFPFAGEAVQLKGSVAAGNR